MTFSRRHVVAYLALAAVVVAVGVRYVVLDGPAPASGERLVLAPASSPSLPAVATAGEATGGTAATEVVVHVCGAVRSPGIIRLAAGSRVADALELAGGATAKANLAGVNLAARVTDGQQIVVPEKGSGGGEAPPTAGSGGGEGGGSVSTGTLVNINTATLTELETLPGVGPATAQKIIDYRTTSGGFRSLDELKNVPGIGDARFAALKGAISI